MILIAHRGNTKGRRPKRENSPSYVLEALSVGYHAEVDIWHQDDEFFLGHDSPEHKTSVKFLRNEKLWCHCKDVATLHAAIKNGLHCFFHQTDDVVLTSKGHMWTYPGKDLANGAICVMPERATYTEEDLSRCMAICSDYVERYK